MDDLTAHMRLANLLGVKTTQAVSEQVAGEMLVSADHCTLGDSVHGGELMAFADSLAASGWVNCLRCSEFTAVFTNFLCAPPAPEES